ncbi:hypothetical protein MAMP_00219 [Methylophaga aminisulfidivorans MP]|uniref:HNH endonuclease 5 domain-containing protein n=1 Tax=Methylophaga aminisulfidivorans MP TaxID=1026882 RepID=F5T1H4_9GAMM|nr:HNH endonuclease [Methylophaga aminisulfidivorans]EGL53070.1 hypothetical protein MAMP_00219 [Methylophaga aminisulfidivorans MP]
MYEAAERCIYCGTVNDSLTREHIIPYALGGELVLPKSSCDTCQKITSKNELIIARQLYGLHRAYEGIKSRRNKNAGKLNEYLEVTGVDNNGRKVTENILVRDLPSFQIIVKYTQPGLLSGKESQFTLESKFLKQGETKLTELRVKLGWSKISLRSPTANPHSFSKQLAKIAHAYCCAELGHDGFEPLLIEHILDKTAEKHITYYVGGYEPQLPQTREGLILSYIDLDGIKYIKVDISLHFFKESPRYQVICGKLNGGNSGGNF